MAAKPSMDEEQAMLPNMHDGMQIDGDLSEFEIWKSCDRFVTPGKTLSWPASFAFSVSNTFSAFILIAWEPTYPDPNKLKSFVIKYSYCQGSPTASKTQTIKKASTLASLCTTAYTFRAKLHTVVNWKGQPLAIIPSEPDQRIFTTFVNGMSLHEGRCKILETGDIISCYELDQPEADFDSVLASTSFDNDGDSPEEEKLTNQRRFSIKSILDGLAITAAFAIAIIFVVVVLGLVVLAILSFAMPQAFTFSKLVHFFRHDA